MNALALPRRSDKAVAILGADPGGIGDHKNIVWPGDRLPPSALARHPSSSVSERYKFVDTGAVIDMMKEEGFQIAGTSVRRKRDPNQAAFGLHVIDFRHPDAPKIAGVVPRILFGNSHDGSHRARISVGAFRIICSNGLVAGTVLASAAVSHAAQEAADLVKRMRELSRNTLPMFQQIERWEKKQLDAAAAREFARLSATLRWGDPHRVKVEDLLQVRREGDDRGDLWTVFNRVQEATTRIAGLEAVAPSGRRTRTQPLNEIGASMRYNSELWQLAEEFSGL